MKINRIQVNGFGNVINKNIEFKDGLNIIHGNNEAGKSTLVYFIKAMLYGVDKNKSGNEFSEVERFKPWSGNEFSGKMEYTFNNKKYSAFRDFNKNNTKVFDETGNDITNDFSKDKSRGAEIGFSHLGVDEETFLNSVFISQGNVDVENNERRSVIQKLTNIIQSGEESVSYDKAKQKLHKYLLDEVGTERTHTKPINVVIREIEAFEKTRDGLVLNRSKRESINDRKKENTKKIEEISAEIESAKKVLEVRERYSNLVSEREKEYDISIRLLEKEKTDKLKKREKQKKDVMSLFILSCGLASAILVLFKMYLWILLPIIILAVALIVTNKMYSGDVNLNLPQDITVVKENLKRKELKELEILNNEGIKESLTSRKLMDVKALVSGLEKSKNDLLLEEHKLKLENEGIAEHIDRLNEVEEQLCDLYEREEDIRKLEFSLKLAMENLDAAYEELRADVVPDIENSIKNNIEKTTNGKYADVVYNDGEGLKFENEFGEMMSVNKLSMGTIDQMYLGFRFAISEKIGDVPLIMDESFAYFDDERLANVLNVLSERAKSSQIFILTCSDREKRCLEKLRIGI